MRNSFNTSGFSEVAHEIQADPREAQYRYGARALFAPGRGVTARTEPALLGSVKSARAFRVAVRTPDALGTTMGSPHEPAPLDLALTAVAACSLKTMVGGGSARGITFESLAMTIEAAFPRTGDSGSPQAPTSSIGYRIRADGAAEGSVLDEVLRQVCGHSPNHRALTDPVPVRLDLGEGAPERVTWDPEALRPTIAQTQTLTRHVRWVSGTQFESRGAEGTGAAVLRVDQPKQLTGVDWGPNPQEYLLMGLASEVALQARRESLHRTGTEGTWDVRARARVDIRGLLGIDDDVPVPLQDVVCVVRPVSAPPDAAGAVPSDVSRPDGRDWHDTARTAMRRSLLADLISRPHPVRTALLHGASV